MEHEFYGKCALGKKERGGRFMSVHMEFRVVFPEFFQLSGLFSKAFYMVVIELIKLSLLLFCTRSIRGFYCFYFFFLRRTFLIFCLLRIGTRANSLNLLQSASFHTFVYKCTTQFHW